MKRRIFMALFLFFGLAVFTNYCFARGGDSLGFAPAPQLVYPGSETVDLSGKDSLEFKWLVQNTMDTQNYRFRLYKGDTASEEAILIKENLPFDSGTFKVDASQFENGQVYLWVLRQEYLRKGTSDPASQRFTVIKK